jgi:hypothetical protein
MDSRTQPDSVGRNEERSMTVSVLVNDRRVKDSNLVGIRRRIYRY